MIKGISVRLFERNKIGEDEFHHPIYEENPIDVENVLVSPSSTTEIVDSLNIFDFNPRSREGSDSKIAHIRNIFSGNYVNLVKICK